MNRPLAIERMRCNIRNYYRDVVRIERDSSDPDTWGVDSGTGLLTKPDLTPVWEGPASIQMPDQTRSREEVDRMEIHVIADAEVLRHDLIQILQSPKDLAMLKHGKWYVVDVDYGTHHISRRLVCARRERLPVERYGNSIDER